MDKENCKNKKKMYKFYLMTKVRMFVTAIVIIGAINWGTTTLGYNLVEMLSKFINTNLKTDLPIDKAIYILVALCGISLASRRTTWLPFLGKTILPGNLVTKQTPAKANKKILIKVRPNAKVAYWAATGKDKKDQDVFDAYNNHSNSGVVIADNKGNAELPIIEGEGYRVPTGKRIPRHIHYRIIGNSMMDRVRTFYY
jgi:uncharacterized membrane protein YuzA (DUF378 family)